MSFKNLPFLFTMLMLMGLAGENLFAQVPATTQEKQLEQEVDSLRHEIKSYNERLNKHPEDALLPLLVVHMADGPLHY